MQDDTWSWVGEDGVEHHGSESQLAAALSAQRLAPYTLVTRASWRDWLPAMSVAELQRVLPINSRDQVRTPILRHQQPKLPPPFHEYPALRLRHQGILQAVSPTPAPSRPRSSIPSSPHLELARYANDEFDEPTVQIDAEELERALNESRVDEAPVTPRSGVRAETPGEGPLVSHELKRRALAQRLAHKMPTYPGYVVSPQPAAPVGSVPPPAPPMPSAPATPRSAPPLTAAALTHPPMTPPSVPSAPVPAPFGVRPESAPKHGAPPEPPPYSEQPQYVVQMSEAASFNGHEPTLTSRIGGGDGDGETAPPRRKLWLSLVALCGTLAGAAWFVTQQTDPSPQAPPAAATSASNPVKLPVPSSEPLRVPLCTVDKQVQVSEFAHAQVRPAVAFQKADGRIALGFAQTGRIAAGVTLDPQSLAINRLYSDNQTSPLWSVTPVVTASDVKFRVSRAASTLRSTVSLPTDPPLFFGLNREGFAARGDADLTDRLIWKSEWDTISMPDVALTSDGNSLVALRAGGERGKLLLGKLTSSGQAAGELAPLTTGPLRIDPPALLVTEKQVLVTYAAGDKPVRDKLFVAASPRNALPTTAKEVLQGDQGIVSPTLARAGESAFAVQYTRGIAGKQEVVTSLLNANLDPSGEPLAVSPAGRDAYEGVIVEQGGQLLSLYFVRQEFGHELWASHLTCK